jgi:hypothetical protein
MWVLDRLTRFIGSHTYPCNYSELPQLQGFHSTQPIITLSQCDGHFTKNWLLPRNCSLVDCFLRTLPGWWLSEHWLLTDSWTKCSPLYSLLADCSENTFCKGPVVTETLPANALYRNSIPLLYSQLTCNVCNCCIIAWFIVGELCLVASLSREQSYMRPQYPAFWQHVTILWKFILYNDLSKMLSE